jgi:hypothetical protein
VGGLSALAIMQSKPPNLALVLAPLLFVIVTRNLWSRTKRGSFVVPLGSGILLGALWYILAGSDYARAAYENQVGETFHYVHGATVKGYFINLATWMRSFWFTLAPLSWIGVWCGITLWRRARQNGWRALTNQEIFLGIWLLEVVPIIAVVAVRPRYLFLSLSVAAILGPKLLAQQGRLPSLKVLRCGLTAVAVIILFVVWGLRVPFHQTDPLVSAVLQDKKLSELAKSGVCVGDSNDQRDLHYAQHLTLLLELELGERVPVFNYPDLPSSPSRGIADKECWAALNARGARALVVSSGATGFEVE